MNSHAIPALLKRLLDAQVRPGSPRRNPDGHEVDRWLDLLVGEDVWHLAIEERAALGQAFERLVADQEDVRARWPDVVPIVAFPRLSARERQRLQDHSINYFDLGGAIWIRHPGLLVQSEAPRHSRPRPPRDRGRNPFSKKASLVARLLLEHPSRAWRVREVSDESALSLGYASEILRSLVGRGYAAEGPEGVHLDDAVSLLQDWAAVYRWEDNEIHSFVVPLGTEEVVSKVSSVLVAHGVKSALTLLAAMDRRLRYVEHDQSHIYVSDIPYPAQSELEEALYAEPVRSGGNLHIMKPYHGESAWYGSEDVDGVGVVSDVQLFLDLIHYPLRGPEAAGALLRKRLGNRIGLTRSQVETLGEGLGLWA